MFSYDIIHMIKLRNGSFCFTKNVMYAYNNLQQIGVLFHIDVYHYECE